MAERRPLVSINGVLQELPQGDTTPGTTGGSSGASVGLTLVAPTGTPNGVLTDFTLPSAPTGDVVVFLNGVACPEVDYSVATTTLTFVEAPHTGDVIMVLMGLSGVGTVPSPYTQTVWAYNFQVGTWEEIYGNWQGIGIPEISTSEYLCYDQGLGPAVGLLGGTFFIGSLLPELVDTAAVAAMYTGASEGGMVQLPIGDTEVVIGFFTQNLGVGQVKFRVTFGVYDPNVTTRVSYGGTYTEVDSQVIVSPLTTGELIIETTPVVFVFPQSYSPNSRILIKLERLGADTTTDTLADGIGFSYVRITQ